MFSGADAHVANSLKAAKLQTDPFAHCVVDGVLPPTVLSALHDRWPSDAVLGLQSDSGRSAADAYQERRMMVLRTERHDQMTADDHTFWHSIGHMIAGPKMISACFQKFGGVLHARVGHLGPDTVLDIEVQIVSDRSNYAIGPHTDSRQRLISMLYYLSDDPRYRTHGTGLYTPKDGARAFTHHIHYPFEDFVLTKRVDYRANRGLIFPRSDRSFHGVAPVTLDNCDRRLLIVNVRAPEGAR